MEIRQKICVIVSVIITLFIFSLNNSQAATISFPSPNYVDKAVISTPSASIVASSSAGLENSMTVNWNNTLLAWWRFNTSNDLNDYSGNNFTASASGATWTANGKFAGAYIFGSGNALSASDSAVLNPTSAMSVSAWIKANSWTANYWQGTILDKSDWADGGGHGYVLRVGEGGKLSFAIGNGTTWPESVSGAVMSTGNWYHVVGTFDGTSIKTFINGKLVKNEPITSTTISPSIYPIKIGTATFAPDNRNFDGTIDDIQIYKRALTNNEIGAMYNSNIPNTLIGYWGFETLGDFYDYSGFDHNATNYGATFNSSGMFDGALSFDGTNYVSIPDANDLDGSVFTFSAWVNHSVTPFWDRIVSKKLNYTDSNGWEISLDSNASSNVYIGGSNRFFATIACTTIPDSTYFTSSTWHLITVVFNGSNATLYCDGVNKGTGSIASVVANNNPLLIGKIKNETNTLWRGLIDDVRIYNSALSDSDVANLYNTHSAPYRNLFANLAAGLYPYDAVSQEITGTITTSASRNLRVVATPDTTAPVISNVSANQAENSSTINWDTDEYASSKVEYGTTQSYGLTTLELDTPVMLTSHSVNISGLNNCTNYYYRVISKDAIGNEATSSQLTFTTAGCPSADNGNTLVCTQKSPTKIPVINSIIWEGNSALITFTTVNDASGYQIYYSQNESADEFSDQFNYSGPLWITTRKINYLDKNKTYYFKIRAVKDCAASDFSQKYGLNSVQVFFEPPKETIVEKISEVPIVKEIVDKQIEVENVEVKPKEEPKIISYIVQQGDSLWKIAKNFFVDIKDIKLPSVDFKKLVAGISINIDLTKLTPKQIEKVAPELSPNTNGYDLDVKVLAYNNQPIKGVKVTLHSNPKEATTNELGVASFKNVEPGKHEVFLAYGDYKGGGQALNVTGDNKNIEMVMQVNLKTGISWVKVAILVAIFSIISSGMTILIIKKLKK